MQNRSNVWSALCIVTTLGAGCGSNQAGTEGTAPSTNPSAGAAGQAAATAPTNSSTPTTGATTAPATGTTGAATNTGTSAVTPGGAAQAPGAATPGAMPGANAAAPTMAAGTPATGTTPANGMAATMTDPNVKMTANGYPDLRGTCGIKSGWAGDEACLPPPPPDQGIQIHVGPKNYEDMAEVSKYVMHPGEESSECWTFHTPNDKDVWYQTYELSGRPGTHHIINTMFRTELTDGGFSVCADPGTGTNGNIIDNLPGASKAYMPRGIVAPENADMGRKIPPNTPAQADMHYYNFTDKDLLREFWMNIYFVDMAKVKRQADQIRAMGGITWQGPLGIAPGTNETYKYECPVSGNGQILSLLGHYHAHGKHFTASIRRTGGMVEKVFEMYDFMDPAQFQYDSVSTNPMFSATAAGALSGKLEIKNGESLMWDCQIINDSDVILTYTNEVKTGEMCNLWGSSTGIMPVNCVQ